MSPGTFRCNIPPTKAPRFAEKSAAHWVAEVAAAMPAEAMDVDKDKKPDEKDKKPEPAPPPVPLTLKQGGQSRHQA